MKERKSYQCDFCAFYRLTKKIVEKHEKYCYNNPKNKACATCCYNIIEFETFYNPNHGGNPGSSDYDIKYNWCNKKEIELTRETLTMNCEYHKLKEDK